MKKFVFLLFFVLGENTVFGQYVDTAVMILQIDSLSDLSLRLQNSDQLEEALKMAQTAKERAQRVLGDQHRAYAKSVHACANVYYGMGLFAKAEPLYLEAKEIHKKTFGVDHVYYAVSLYSLANLYSEMDRGYYSEELYIEAKNIYERKEGKESIGFISCLNSLSLLYRDLGRYKDAVPLFVESKDIREKVFGKTSAEYATSVNSLAILYDDLGRFDEAETLFKEAIETQASTIGTNHSEYASTVDNLASMYNKLGRYSDAKELYSEALNIRKRTVGGEHPNYALSLNNFGDLYEKMGDFATAEDYLMRSKNIREKILGKEHPTYSYSLNNLASLYEKMGRFIEAEQMYEEALQIVKKSLGESHPRYAVTLNNFATLYARQSRFKDAERLLLEAKERVEQSLRDNNLTNQSANNATLTNLACVYAQMGQYKKSRKLFKSVKSSLKEIITEESPEYASLLSNMGVLYKLSGRHRLSEKLQIEAINIRQKILDKEHPEYIESLHNLGMLYREMRRYQKMAAYFSLANTLSQRLLTRSTRHLSNREMAAYIQFFENDSAIRYSYTYKKCTPEMRRSLFDNALFYKGFLLAAATRMRTSAQSDSVAAALHNRLSACQVSLTQQYTLPVRERASKGELEEKANLIEKEIARRVSIYAQESRQITWKDVQTALHPGEAAVEFVHFPFYDKKLTDSVLYVALFVRAGDTVPEIVYLFEEKKLAALLDEKGISEASTIEKRYRKPHMPNRKRGQQNSLYELIWQPLAKSIAGSNTVYFAPSGLLHRVNLAAVATGEKTMMADNFNLVRLNSTRQLVVQTESAAGEPSALLFGDIEYDSLAHIVARSDSSFNGEIANVRGEFDFSMPDSTPRGGAWRPLKSTGPEVDAISQTLAATGFRPEVFKATAASEEVFKNIGKSKPSPKVIHIATHGFFFPNTQSGVRNDQVRSDISEPVFKNSEHPLIRSGLILAGGNYIWQGKKPQPGQEDGILTAYEITQMNLSGTELVVLSACETGLGDIPAGSEGVYGLQRAFKIAGAKHLIMSLWKVPDTQTQELMTVFYKNWLEQKMTIRESLAAAQKTMRDKGYSHYYWAGFVLIE